MKRSLIYKLTCIFAFIIGLFSFSSGYSDYVIDKTSYDESSTLANKSTSANDNGEKVTVSFKYVTYYGSEWENVDGYTNQTINDETSYNKLKNYFSSNIDASFGEFEPNTHGPFNGKNTQSNYYFQLIVTSKIYTKSHLFKKDEYFGSYTLQRKLKGISSNNYNDDIKAKITINKGAQLNSCDLNSVFDLSKNGYTFAGLKSSSSDSTFIDLKQQVSNDVTYYAIFYSNDPIFDQQVGNLTTTINSTVATTEFYKGASNWTCDVSKDASFVENDNKVYLGTGSVKTTVKSGATIRFLLNNGKETIEMGTNGNGINFNPEDGKHELQYTVSLANDLIINGAFTIGGNYGSNTNAEYQSHLVKEYVCLDLNGHDIYVNNGGELWSYGLIKDSKGMGHIYVDGGTIYTLATIMDYHGGASTSYCVGSSVNMMPFNCYQFPYIRTSVVFTYNGTWGKLIGKIAVTVQTTIGTTTAKPTLNVIGPDNGDYLFKMKSGTNGKSKLIFEGYYEKGLSKTFSNNRTIELSKSLVFLA